MNASTLLIPALVAATLIAACDRESTVAPADIVLLDGLVYTVDPERTIASAVAVRDGEIIFVGGSEEARRYAGPETRTVHLDGRMVLPGLHDVHLHMFGIVDPDICTLESEPLSLPEIAAQVRECLDRYDTSAGEWMTVEAWSFSIGNQPGLGLETLRQALDVASTEHPIMLWGNDGHHGAVNSAALALVKGRSGERVGLNAETLRAEFAEYVDLVATDSGGEPTGGLNEQARYLVDPPVRRDMAARGPLLPQIADKLASLGVTSIQDASLEPGYLPYLEEHARAGGMSFRLKIANRLDPIDYTDAETGLIDIDRMMTELAGHRARFESYPLISADAAKIYADGVIEGDPFASPPTLPNGAMLQPFLQPRFKYDSIAGAVGIVGYVDTGSQACVDAREAMVQGMDASAEAAFIEANNFHPRQCRISRGVMRDSEAFIHDYVARLDAAGFAVHLHAIGDRAARIGTNALEKVMDPDAGNPLRHTLAHLHVVHPEDQERIGRLGLYLAITHAWAAPDRPYDLTVIPFIDEVSDDTLYRPDGYYLNNVYPARSLMGAGGVLVGASDAPVDDLSPRPFFNIGSGISRMNADGEVLNAAETVDIHAMIAAYTVNAARVMGHEDRVGSIEVGKRADLAVIDRNILTLAETGGVEAITSIIDTQVDLTIFDGAVIFDRASD